MQYNPQSFNLFFLPCNIFCFLNWYFYACVVTKLIVTNVMVFKLLPTEFNRKVRLTARMENTRIKPNDLLPFKEKND